MTDITPIIPEFPVPKGIAEPGDGSSEQFEQADQMYLQYLVSLLQMENRADENPTLWQVTYATWVDASAPGTADVSTYKEVQDGRSFESTPDVTARLIRVSDELGRSKWLLYYIDNKVHSYLGVKNGFPYYHEVENNEEVPLQWEYIVFDSISQVTLSAILTAQSGGQAFEE